MITYKFFLDYNWSLCFIKQKYGLKVTVPSAKRHPNAAKSNLHIECNHLSSMHPSDKWLVI